MHLSNYGNAISLLNSTLFFGESIQVDFLLGVGAQLWTFLVIFIATTSLFLNLWNTL